MGLTEYKRKRDFHKTAEPAGGKPLPKSVKGASRFVIQKHDASRLHYDFRLEIDGVLKSWAVPKGLPWQQGEKHLAVEVEDHPVEYATFEGIIPEGQYGGGTVMVWDRGKYYVYGENPLKSWQEGKLHLVLEGKKAKGEWTLIRLRGDSSGKNQWLLLKTGSSNKQLSKKLDDQSVKSGRSMREIAQERDAEWQSNRIDQSRGGSFRARIRAAVSKGAKTPKKKVRRATSLSDKVKVGRPSAKSGAAVKLPSNLPAAKPRFIEPMKPRLVETPPVDGNWSYELKFDGIRAIAIKQGHEVNLISRNKNELRSRFPEIAEALQTFPASECVIDGEIVALDDKGRSSFQLLQALEMEGRKSPVRFYLFDLLQLNGRDVTQLPLTQRKELLATVCDGIHDPLRYSGELGGDAASLLAEVRRLGLEGIIGKQRDSIYEAGRRSGAWIKIKCLNEQEFVIGGYTPPGGSRKHFGAILVGYYEFGTRGPVKSKPAGDAASIPKLLFAGKVGTGFNSKSLSALIKKFREEERHDCPFADLPSKQGGQWVQGITPSMMRQIHWVQPVLVAQIRFAEWTRDGKLRQPVYLGLREDKVPKEVVREV